MCSKYLLWVVPDIKGESLKVQLERYVYENQGLLTYFLRRGGRASPILFRVTERKFWNMLSSGQVGCLNHDSQATPLIILYIITLSHRELPEMSSKARR